MSWTLLLSWQQLRFYWRQAVLATLGIAVGVMVLMIILSFSQGINEHYTERILQLYPALSLEAGINDQVDEKLLEQILAVEGVTQAAPYLRFPGMISRGLAMENVMFKGVVWELENELHNLSSNLTRGDWESIKEHSGVVIGNELAHNLQATVGDWVEIISPRGSIHLVVDGIFTTGYYPTDVGLVLLPLRAAQQLMETDKVTGYGVNVQDLANVESYILPLQQATDLWVRPWYEQQQSLFISLQVQREVMLWISSFTFLVAIFGVANVFLLRVLSQKRTVGILRCLGVSFWQIIRVLIYQGLICGIIGGLIGLGAARLVVVWLGSYPIHMAEIYYMDNLPIVWAANDALWVLASAIVASGLAVMYPAYRLSRVDPAEVIQYGSY